MSQSYRSKDQNSDSDATYCPEIEPPGKRRLKKPIFFQSEAYVVRTRAQTAKEIIKGRKEQEKETIMSQSYRSKDQNSDSDATYCPEIEPSGMRLIKNPDFFQSEAHVVRKRGQTAKNIIKGRKEQEKGKILRKLRSFKAKNMEKHDAIFQLTEQLKNCEIRDTQKRKSKSKLKNTQKRKLRSNDCSKNKISNEVASTYNPFQESQHSCDLNTAEILNHVNFGHRLDTKKILDSMSANTYALSQGPQYNYDLATNEIRNRVNFDHEFDAKENLDSMINFDVAEELQQTSDIDMNDILNCLNYDPSQDINPNFSGHDAPQVFQDTCKREALNLESSKGFQDNFGASHTNGVLNNNNGTNFEGFQDPVHNFNNEFDAAGKSNHNSENKPISNTSFENFAQTHLSKCNKITLLSDVTILKRESQGQQQLMDKCLSDPAQTHTLKAENQTEEFSVKNENKTAGKHNKKRATRSQDPQATAHNYFSAENNNENENKTMAWEAIGADAISPKEKKNKELQLSLMKAVEMMEICKQKFKLRLLAKKEEILKWRNSQPSRETREPSSLFNFPYSSQENKLAVEADNSLAITKEEMLQNMQGLYEVSAYYKKKYKSQGIDILND